MRELSNDEKLIFQRFSELLQVGDVEERECNWVNRKIREKRNIQLVQGSFKENNRSYSFKWNLFDSSWVVNEHLFGSNSCFKQLCVNIYFFDCWWTVHVSVFNLCALFD